MSPGTSGTTALWIGRTRRVPESGHSSEFQLAPVPWSAAPLCHANVHESGIGKTSN